MQMVQMRLLMKSEPIYAGDDSFKGQRRINFSFIHQTESTLKKSGIGADIGICLFISFPFGTRKENEK